MFSVQSIQKKFGKRSLFSDVTLDLQAGKVYALIGASGSGKTTLLNILAKLESYDAGDILYKGKDLKKLKPHLFFKGGIRLSLSEFWSFRKSDNQRKSGFGTD